MKDLTTFGINKGDGKYHEEAIYTLALLYNLINGEISSYLKDYDLTPGKLNVLVVIKHHGGEQGICQVDISKHLIVTPSNMTKMIDKLENEGLVTRSALEGDRRVNITKVTKKGYELLEVVWGGYEEKLKKLTHTLNQGKQKQLADILTEWFEGLK